MKVYIRSAASISPQNTFNNPAGLNELVEYNGNRLTCIEPDYSEVIGPKLIRRMSRVIKMSVASAFACLKDAGAEKPEAIVTGTAYGCLEDTGTFLTNMVEQDEEPISPVAFVQSTHNTIGAQIALLLKCNGYNNTFVSGGASFENALTDAMMLLHEGNNEVLVGGMDEITDMSHTILSRSGIYKREPVSNFNLFSQNKGTIDGEGAAFFMLSNMPNMNNLACIDAVATFYKPESDVEIAQHIEAFLTAQGINSSNISLLITGNNGDVQTDATYTILQKSIFKGIPSITYKKLCGEYPTATAFATWLAANSIKNNAVPTTLNIDGDITGDMNKILIYNHYQNINHSLTLLSAC